MQVLKFILAIHVTIISSASVKRDLPKCPMVIGVGEQLFKDGVISAQTINRVIISKQSGINCIDTSAKGEFKISINIYSDETYATVLMESNKQNASYNQSQIFHELSLETAEEDLFIKPITCYATPDSNPNNNIKYTYLQDGCPLDPTMVFYPKSDRKRRRFSLKSFRFMNSESNSVYLFCHVAVCSEKVGDTKQCFESKCSDEENLTKEIKPAPFKNDNKTEENIYGVECGSSSMTFVLKKPLPTSVVIEDLHLINQSCKAFENKTHVLFKTPLHQCGTTQHKLSSGTFIYKNEVLQTIKTFPIQRTSEVLQAFSCRYGNTYKSSISIAKVSKKLAKNFRSHAFGNYNVTIEQYNDATYAEKSLISSANVDSNADMFFQVSISSVFNLDLFLDECFASPLYRSSNKEKFTFIENGCAKDKSLRFYKTADVGKVRFSVKPFSFENSSSMFISCYVSACDAKDKKDNKCKRGCVE